MLRTFSSRAAHSIYRHLARESGVLLYVLLPFFAVSAVAALPPDNDKTDVKKSLVQFRAYLPTIRHKALLDNQRRYVADLERSLELYEVYVAGGLTNQFQKGLVEEGLLKERIRLLQRDRDYRDSLDQFTLRFDLNAERRRQMENAAVSPLANLFRRFVDLSQDAEAADYALIKMGSIEDATKLRPALVKLLTTSALVKDTSLPKHSDKDWGEWEKIDDIEKLLKRRSKVQKDSDDLRQRQAELKAEGKELPRADRQRLEDLLFASDFGYLELELRSYERQPRDLREKEGRRLLEKNNRFLRVARSGLALLDWAIHERLDRLGRSWPKLAPIRVQDMDLLTLDQDKAERAVDAMLKTPDAQRAGRSKTRQLFALAAAYRLQQRIFILAQGHKESIVHEQVWPRPRATGESDTAGRIGPVAPRPQLSDPCAAEPFLRAQASCAEARAQLLQTWIAYQMVRLDLYADLGLSPP
ncbi:MAG TPA: hypothetical protein VH682_30880 [Gemmataceae bacterium]|jgi:hypothetical protein